MSAAAGEAEILRLGGREVRLPRPEKVLFPATGFTKRDLAAYYADVAPALLPHLARRPATLARWPDGVLAPGFFQSDAPPGRPPWLEVAPIATRGGRVLAFPLLDAAAALAWAAAAAAIELHPFLWTVDRPGAPRALVLDLDPGPPAGLAAAARVALRARERLERRGLEAAVKTSGGKGLHLVVPLDGSQGFEGSKALARRLAAELAAERPGEVVDRMALALRPGKVLVDWRQNDAGLSTIAPYSLRGAAVPVASMPVRWEEVEGAAERGETLRFGPEQVRARLDAWGDLLAKVPVQRLPE